MDTGKQTEPRDGTTLSQKAPPVLTAEDVAARIEGTKCGFKNTSCPDQLAKAIKEALSL